MKNDSAWLIFALGSALFGGITAILAKIGVAGIDSNLATFYRTFVVLVLAGLIVGLRGEWASAATVPVRSWVFLGLSGLATGASWLCYYRALQLAPASRVAPIDKLSVVVAVLLGVLVLAEPLSARLIGGVVLIAAGALLIAGI